MNPTQKIGAGLASALVLALVAMPLIGSRGHESTALAAAAPVAGASLVSAETPQDEQWDMTYADPAPVR